MLPYLESHIEPYIVRYLTPQLARRVQNGLIQLGILIAFDVYGMLRHTHWYYWLPAMSVGFELVNLYGWNKYKRE